MSPVGFATSCVADRSGDSCNRSVAHRRQALSEFVDDDESGGGFYRDMSMAFFARRAFQISASWLLLCGMGSSAMSQDAASSAATQLPGITVTSPSPIVRRNVVPSRTPERVARTVPNRNRAPTPPPAPQIQPTPPAAAPQQGVLPIVTDQFATVTVVPNEEIRREGGAQLGVLLDAGGGNFALHADAYGRKTTDYYIPSYPYLFDPTKPFNGHQPNSATRTDGASIGGSYIFDGGFIGAAITQNDALYHRPGIDGADHQTRIDAHQTKITAKGEYRPDSAAIDAVR